MIYSISGVGYAGAGAYFDLLCEYKTIEHTPNLFELGILYEPDGVIDLVNKLKFNNSKLMSYVPIKRFLHLAKFYNNYHWFSKYTSDFLYQLSVEFIKSLDILETKGYQYHEISYQTFGERVKLMLNRRFLTKLSKSMHRDLSFDVTHEMLICLDSTDIEKKARDYMTNLLFHFLKNENHHLLIKHLCPPDMPYICLPYLPDSFRQISVNRDPRDLYILGKKNHTNDFPCNSVEDFVRYYKATILRQKPCEKVLYLNFEDLCYKYEETVRKIEAFCELNKGERGDIVFHPEKSINNTKLYLKEKDYESDVKYIEANLSEYLYSY